MRYFEDTCRCFCFSSLKVPQSHLRGPRSEHAAGCTPAHGVCTCESRLAFLTGSQAWLLPRAVAEWASHSMRILSPRAVGVHQSLGVSLSTGSESPGCTGETPSEVTV